MRSAPPPARLGRMMPIRMRGIPAQAGHVGTRRRVGCVESPSARREVYSDATVLSQIKGIRTAGRGEGSKESVILSLHIPTKTRAEWQLRQSVQGLVSLATQGLPMPLPFPPSMPSVLMGGFILGICGEMICPISRPGLVMLHNETTASRRDSCKVERSGSWVWPSFQDSSMREDQ